MVKWFRSILGVGLPKSIDFFAVYGKNIGRISYVTLSNGFRLLGKFNRGLRLQIEFKMA